MKVIIFLFFLFCLVWTHPSTRDATTCHSSQCKIENGCRCSSTINPSNDPNNPAPQLIAITVSESIVETLYDSYIKPLFFDRTNPDGRPIGATFFVNHEYTDYSLVQELYLQGFEIGVHSVTKNSSQEYWRHATLEDLIEEFKGQRQIISNFANIPIEDIVGARTPQLQLEGDLSIEAYKQAGLMYDNSWPTRSSQRLFPYTLDYASVQECDVARNCPKESHPGFWIAPITNIHGQNDVECNSLATCLVEGTAQTIAFWLENQVDQVHNTNRAPLVLRLDSYWFEFTHNSFEGFKLFLDHMASRNDLYFVSVADIIEWTKNPVPAKDYQTPRHDDRYGECLHRNCRFTFFDGSERYMKSCIPCPASYPWKGNPMGNIL